MKHGFSKCNSLIRENPCHPWLNSAAFLQQLVDQAHSCLRSSAGAKLCDGPLHSSCPIQIRRRAGNIESVFPCQQIGDHHDGNPSLAFKKSLHNRRIKIFFEIGLADLWIESGKGRDLGQIKSRLLRCHRWMLESFLPQRADRLVIVGRVSRNGKPLIFVSDRAGEIVCFSAVATGMRRFDKIQAHDRCETDEKCS